MDASRFDRLTKRHRECLRAVRGLQGSKEIADALGIEKSTVDGYLTEAVRLLGAKNRRDAALQLAQHEAEAVTPSPDPGKMPAPAFVGTTPDKIGGDSARLSTTPDPLPVPSSPDEPFVGQHDRSNPPSSRSRGLPIGLPYRRKGQTGNDLSVGERLIWIQVIVVGMAVGFGMLTTGLQVLTAILERIARLLS